MKNPLFAALLLLLGGCASMPDVTEHYYFPAMDITYTVTQLLTCNVDKSKIYTRVVVTRAVKPVADVKAQYSFSFKQIDQTLSDTSLAFSIAPDGRLLGINGSSTGQGAAVVKSVVALGLAIAAAGPNTGKKEEPPKASAIRNSCGIIEQFGSLFTQNSNNGAPEPLHAASATAAPAVRANNNGGAGGKTGAKILTLTYTLSAIHVVTGLDSLSNIILESDTTSMVDQPELYAPLLQDNGTDSNNPLGWTLQPDLASKRAYDALHQTDLLSTLAFHVLVAVNKKTCTNNDYVSCKPDASYLPEQTEWTVADDVSPSSSPAHYKDGGNFAALALNKFAAVRMIITGPNDDFSSEKPLWNETFDLPQRSDPYYIPVPIGKLIGSNAFAVSLNDDGSIQKISYGKTTGTSDAIDAVTSIGKAVQKETPEEKAEEVQGRADYIYEQERLLVCENPTATCAK